MTGTYSFATTVESTSVYRYEPITPPGYICLGFRPPKKGEFFLSAMNGHLTEATENFRDIRPRFIIQRVKRKVYTFRATGERRQANPGEWYDGVKHPGTPVFYHVDLTEKTTSYGPYDIYTLEETEE